MYKVFFADDEAAMRAGIRSCIDWDSSQYILTGEAPDGELALSLMRDMMPDILITDVRMPFMDGIELSRRAKKAFPWLKIIILSGHDEFEYAKQAITIGVEEYLLKPVTSEKLMETLMKVAERIEEERKGLENIERLMNDSRQIQAERLLSGLLYGSADLEAALMEAEELGMPLAANYYMTLLFELHVSETESYTYLQNACARAMGVLSGWENVIFFSQGYDRILCVLKGAEEAALEEEAYACAQAVKYEAEREGDCSVSAAVGSIVSKIADWPKSLADANMARRYLNLTDRKQIVSVHDIRSDGRIPFKEAARMPMSDKLRYASEADIPRFLEECFGNYDSSSMASFMYLNYVYMDILMASSKMLEELCVNPEEILSEYMDVSGILTSNADAEAVKKILSSILKRTIKYRNSLTGSKYNDVISAARKYIQENFAEQDISLNTVATAVSMSPNHFSTVFSQETGETFISYLTRIRLEHAKTLLKTTNMRTSDVGYSVGYNDTHYFSYVFKKNTGMTPKDFRK